MTSWEEAKKDSESSSISSSPTPAIWSGLMPEATIFERQTLNRCCRPAGSAT